MFFRNGMIGRKVGMTQIFQDGARVPVSVVELGPNMVVQKKTPEGPDGYGAIQLGFDDKDYSDAKKRRKKVNKAMGGHFKRADMKPKWILREIRVPDATTLATFNEGQQIKCDIFQEGEMVDVTGTTKGKGYAGVMKMHHMKGNRQATHGTHEYRRHTGSIGCRATPGRVHPGKRMPGQMGNEIITTQNLKIVKIDAEKNLVLIHGSIPGAPGGYVMVRQAIKKIGLARAKKKT